MAIENMSHLSDEARARIDFVRSVVPKRKPHYVQKSLIGLVLLLIVVGLVWLVGSNGSNNKNKPKTSKPLAPAVINLSSTTPTAAYSSNFFGLNLKYPKNWSVKDNNAGVLDIGSPLTNLAAASGKSVIGDVIFTITKQGALPSGITTGTDLAVLDSTLLTYVNPSTDQSGQTYLSFVQYSSTNIKGGLDGVYVTGNFGYQKDQVISPSDINNLNPLIYVSFNECANSLCSKELPLTIASSSWPNVLGQIVNSMVESFVFN